MCVKTLRTFHSENSLMLGWWYAPISAQRIWTLLKIHLNSLLRMRRLQQHSNKSSKVVRNDCFPFSSSRFVKESNRIDIFRHPVALNQIKRNSTQNAFFVKIDFKLSIYSYLFLRQVTAFSYSLYCGTSICTIWYIFFSSKTSSLF